jgi:hypothetical protein
MLGIDPILLIAGQHLWKHISEVKSLAFVN